MTLEDFFDALQREHVSYVVLRWFEDLPDVEPGHDIDILVSDEHVGAVQALLADRPGVRGGQQHIDVFSSGGLPQSNQDGVPHLPPHFARRVLHTAVWHRGRYRVPEPECYLLGLAFHAAYHKGYRSGLRSTTRPDAPPERASHDYEAVVTRLAGCRGTPLIPTLEGLDEFLAGEGLRPPLDMLRRYAASNRWVWEHFFARASPPDPVWHGLTVFTVRERAEGRLDVVLDVLDREGFEVLDVIGLDDAQRETARQRVRGGNWERGPWPLSGGPPTVYVVAYDVAPLPGVETGGWEVNLRTVRAKADAREALLSGLPAGERYNPLHSSDDPSQALDYLEALGDPDLIERLRLVAGELLDVCAMPYPVVRRLGDGAPGRRSQVAVVDHPVHGESVCKVFRPGAARFFRRELRARQELADHPFVPSLLERGANWVLSPVYEDTGRHIVRRLPGRRAVQLRPEATRALATFALELHRRGMFLLDLSSRNVVSDAVVGLKVLDFEYLQDYQGVPPRPEDSYTLRGLPRTDETDSRYDRPQSDDFGNTLFHPAISGLPVEALLRPLSLYTVGRSFVVQLLWWVRMARRPLARRILSIRRLVRKAVRASLALPP